MPSTTTRPTIGDYAAVLAGLVVAAVGATAALQSDVRAARIMVFVAILLLTTTVLLALSLAHGSRRNAFIVVGNGLGAVTLFIAAGLLGVLG